MRRSKEIMILFALLVTAAACVLGYVINRRAQNRAAAAPPTERAPAGPLGPVDSK